MPKNVKRSAKKPLAKVRKRIAKPKAKKRVKASPKRKSKARPKAKAKSRTKPKTGVLSKVKALLGGTAQAKKPAVKKPEGEEIGVVIGYFRLPKAGIIKVTKGSLKVGDMIWISGHTTDLRRTIRSMQIDRAPIQVAKKGHEIGIQVGAKVRRNDRVFKISSA